MPNITLTARGVAALEAHGARVDYWDDLRPGFGVRVSATGSRTFFVRYRVNGQQRRMALGKFPTTTLADARERARLILSAAQAGEDPALERTAQRSGDNTFRAMAREVLDDERRAKTRGATKSERERILAAELVPVWGNRVAASITRRDVMLLRDQIAKRGPTMANRVVAMVKMLFNGAIDRQFGNPIIETNPAARIHPLEEGSRARYLDRDEIRRVWLSLEVENPVTRGVFRLALLTAQRIGSVCSMRWADVDDADVWTIPAESFKGRRPHAVPLSKEALAVLEDLRPLRDEEHASGAYVFPGRADGATPHMASISKALQRIVARSELPAWTAHDFRRSFRTHATRAAKPANKKDPSGLGVAPNVADAVLGHLEASLGFDRYTAEPERYLLAEKREALKRWGTFVLAATKAHQKT